MIAGLLLAAGRSSRFGGEKLCALVNGQPVIRWSLRAVAELDDVLVVTRPDADDVTSALAGARVRVVHNAQFAEGMSTSIRVGIDSLDSDTRAVVIALGDQPFASADVTRSLVQCFANTGADIVAPRYRNGQGNPVLFSRTTFDALRALRGDVGARAVIESGAFAVRVLEVDGDIPIDVDTPDALALASRRATDEASISHPSA